MATTIHHLVAGSRCRKGTNSATVSPQTIELACSSPTICERRHCCWCPSTRCRSICLAFGAFPAADPMAESCF
ncbi:hypothetical protein RHGRI_003377 [Rhododendron griersonianum]|uniref:Uncharacterized protein n=1 Tax=Rhododendron griersonianum TaxID=479676 RepID=A0AAV6L7E9_9ERIC|nr:hypothetical protein RHGRI_003377 [Rhododendron griersonianum]